MLALGALSIALVLFGIAAVAAIGVVWPREYLGPTVRSLRTAPDHYWTDSEPDALRMITHTRLTMLDAAKKLNSRKADFLEVAVGLEVGGSAILVVAAILVLLRL